MKNNLILICLLGIISYTASAKCDDEKVKGNGKVVSKERALASFDKINLAGSIDIIIDQNGNEAVTVEADENLQEYIVTEIKDGALNIHEKEHYNLNATKLIVHVSCSSLNAINSGGSGDVKTVSPVKGDDFSISHGGSGDFDLTFAVKKLKISTAGSGDYVLKGTADEFNLSSAGSGDVHAKELACTTAKISSAGSGDVVLRKGVTASVSSVGSGDVSYE
ncbi:MAG TPA: head GIN domain-containing protein [Bacteroidia bacterium]|nr:head GIN domain-containing protein [Bacteroidia bacterium]